MQKCESCLYEWTLLHGNLFGGYATPTKCVAFWRWFWIVTFIYIYFLYILFYLTIHYRLQHSAPSSWLTYTSSPIASLIKTKKDSKHSIFILPEMFWIFCFVSIKACRTACFLYHDLQKFSLPPIALHNRNKKDIEAKKECGRRDLNPHGIATTGTWSLRVCQFRHFRISFAASNFLRRMREMGLEPTRRCQH